jgi:hypothetical protein
MPNGARLGFQSGEAMTAQLNKLHLCKSRGSANLTDENLCTIRQSRMDSEFFSKDARDAMIASPIV